MIISIDTKNRIIRIDTGIKTFNFDESKVKRDKDGQFASKDGGSGKKTKKEPVPEEEFFGEAFSVYSGKPEEAITKLMKEKRGHVPAAISKEGIGDIDFVYGKGGENGYGLAHIAEKHGEEILKELPQLIKNGTVDDTQKDIGVSFIISQDKKIIISLNYSGKARNWLLSSYKVDR